MHVFDGAEFDKYAVQATYPNTATELVPVTYSLYGRVTLYGHVIGSVLPGGNNNSSSVILAFWPTKGDNITSFDHTALSIGVVQHFIKPNNSPSVITAIWPTKGEKSHLLIIIH